MRKILLTGVTAALALSLTACNFNASGKVEAAPGSTGPGSTASAPSETGPTSGTPTRTPRASTPGSHGSQPGPASKPCDANLSPIRQGACQITSKWGRLRYLAPGKYTVGDTAFFTTQDTVLVVASGTCPDGTSSGPNMHCSLDGIDKWVQAAPHNATVHFNGGNATKIQETQ
ncbi:hypothetical protein [Actinomadura harenae]|uniref:Uncharacterized protein n=1 Tax=Actinomadura harenae TaxID=2483351 RepID=A0A3M2LMG1_9ACTN|nr:hypothetical protein [Actinomadura harenae]RMI38010.1 hypothetical protein EBO15_34265 [Actinomadura harenae]